MKNKFKIFALWFLGIVIMVSMPVSAIAYGAGTEPDMEIRFYTNEHWSGEQTVPIMLEKGKILVPLRLYSSALGFAVSYSSKTKQTTVGSPKTTMIVQAGSKLATVNGKKRTMPIPLRTVRGSSWISLDWIAEVFPAKIDGRYLTLEENYYRAKVDKDELILNAQSGDLYLSVAGGAPRKVGTVHPKLSIGGLYAEKTANGNYYVEANEVWGDTASSMYSNTTALYIWNRQVLLQATMDESIKSVRQYKDRVFFMKDGKTLVIDDKTGQTLQEVPVYGLLDVQGSVWAGNTFLYFPETGALKSIEDLLDEKGRQAVREAAACGREHCPPPLSYAERKGDKLVFNFIDRKIVVDPKTLEVKAE